MSKEELIKRILELDRHEVEVINGQGYHALDSFEMTEYEKGGWINRDELLELIKESKE